jgi:glucosamine--fructose-6-phosphate aminotransferase (isomerizing)
MSLVTIAHHRRVVGMQRSNIREVRARSGQPYVLADAGYRICSDDSPHVIRNVGNRGRLSPILHMIRLQMHWPCVRDKESREVGNGGVAE